MKRVCLAVLVLAILPHEASAEGLAHYGNFDVKIERDRFGDHDTAIASVMSGTGLLAARCLNGELSLAFIESIYGQGRWEEGMPASVKIKVDDGPVMDLSANGINDKAIEIYGVGGIIRDMAGANEVALRITAREIVQDRVFKLKQSNKAITPVLTACHATPQSYQPKMLGKEPSDPTARLLNSLPAEPPPPPAAPKAPADGNVSLPDAASAQVVVLAPVLSAAMRCGYVAQLDKLGKTVETAMPANQTITPYQMVLAMGALSDKLVEEQKWKPAATPTEKDAYCAQAKAAYGDDGTIIKGALH